MQHPSVPDAECIGCGEGKPCKATCSRSEGRSSGRVAAKLTDRELAICRVLADGRGTKGAAHELGVEATTIKKRVAGIVLKLHARSATHAVAMLVRAGLI